MRVPKRPAGQENGRCDAAHARLERLLWEHVPEYVSAAHQVHRSWLFAAHVLVPLLGERAAAAGTLVTAPAEFVQALSRAAPGGIVADTDEEGRCVCVLLPDHTHFPVRVLGVTPPVVTVELKPKCGFLPNVRAAQRCAKRSVTRFAMHQRLKVKDGHVSKVRAFEASSAQGVRSPVRAADESVLPAGPVLARARTHAHGALCAVGCAAKQLDGPMRRQAGVWRCWLLWQSPCGEACA